MDGVLVESSLGPSTVNLCHRLCENHEGLLKESMARFFRDFSKGIRDFSGFRSIFFRLLQSRSDPPLEIIWFYFAMSFHGGDSSNDDALSRILAVKGLFQNLSACSSSLDGVKSIALLAPVLFNLHYSVVDLFSSSERSTKSSKKLAREVECLMEGILGYIGICSSSIRAESDGHIGVFSVGLLPSFADLTRVWVVNRLKGNWEDEDSLQAFFPLVSDEVRERLLVEGYGIGYLAGIVIVEAFLLRLCLKVREGFSRSELQKELKVWAVASITGFRNCAFFEILLKLLLEPTLPLTSLLSSGDEAFLREVLYDSAVFVDYSFLDLKMTAEPYDDQKKTILFTWLIAAHEAIRHARLRGDLARAISYSSAFSRSQLPSQLIKWVTRHMGMNKSSLPNLSTPQALLRWLRNLEDRGFIDVFGDSLSKYRSTLVLSDTVVDAELSIFNPDQMKADDDLLFMDKEGQQREEESVEDDTQPMLTDAMFISAAHGMKFTSSNARRKKRKEAKAEGEKQVKFRKFKSNDASAENPLLPRDDETSSSGGEVDDPLSGDDVEEMEQ